MLNIQLICTTFLIQTNSANHAQSRLTYAKTLRFNYKMIIGEPLSLRMIYINVRMHQKIVGMKNQPLDKIV